MSSPQQSEVQRLGKLLKEAQQRAEAADQRASQAERDKLQAEQDKVQAERDKLQAEERNQKTTFHEFLQACHGYLHKPLRVETRESWTTKGVTNPARKYYPKTLKVWEDYSTLQDEVFSKVCNVFSVEGQQALRLFSPLLSIEDQGRLHCNIQIANEATLRTYQKAALEVYVTDIISRLSELRDFHEYELGQGVVFENDANSLNDMADEVQERLRIEPPRTPPPVARQFDSPDLEINPQGGRTRADQYCIYKEIGGKRELLFVVEYKSPHKLSIGNLTMGFREMDLKKEVIDRIDIPKPIPKKESDEIFKSEQGMTPKNEAITARLQYNADKAVMAVATQTFHYMIENGLEYSYITTGEAFIFLRIKENDPTTLYYHVTVPNDEISETDAGFPYSQTAIAQVASLCLMAFKSEQRDQRWRVNAKKQLEKYPINSLETVQMETPASERKLAARRKRVRKSPLYKGGKAGPVTSNYMLRSKCKLNDPAPNPNDEPDDPDMPSGPARPSTGSPGQNQQKSLNNQKDNGGSGSDQAKGSNQAKGSQEVQRQYCTQKCLLGITRGSTLDKNCPNVPLHPRRGKKHAVNQSKFLKLVQSQLAEDLDHNCEPLGLQGARGALFKVTLASHGYVFVGKGTVYAFVPDLLHEGKMYGLLSKLQGTAVPVCLGNINLLEWYYLDVGVRILHMLLMSWGGNLVDDDESVKDSPNLPGEIERTTAEVLGEGVDQMDIRPPNLLWNQEVQRVMLIDFERAVTTKRSKDSGMREGRALQEISPNKKRKRAGSSERKTRPRISSA